VCLLFVLGFVVVRLLLRVGVVVVSSFCGLLLGW
jgi:hypothetical protein